MFKKYSKAPSKLQNSKLSANSWCNIASPFTYKLLNCLQYGISRADCRITIDATPQLFF